MSYRDNLKAALKPRTTRTTFQEQEIWLRELSARDWVEWNALANQGNAAQAAFLVGRAVVDETGIRVFTDDDLAELQESGPVALMELANKVLEASGLAQAKPEEAAETFERARSDGSFSG